jgi:phage gp29-like protein
MASLVDHLGRPIKKEQLTKELAAPSLSGVRTVWDNTVTSGLTPHRLALMLQGAAAGDMYDYLTLAEEMEERDLHYRCEIGKRKLAVSSLPVSVEAYSDSTHDVKLADDVRALVKRAGFRGLLKDLLDAIGKGYSVAEIIWQRGATWWPERYEWRDPRFFTFDRESRRQIRLLDEEDMINGIPLAPYKFIVHLPHLKTGIPIRGGLARVAAWSYLCKNYDVKDWLAFVEVFGMPLRVGKYGAGASGKDIDVLKMAVANLGSDAAAVIPESMKIEFIESGKKGGGESIFQALADWLDAQVSKGILGQTASSSGTPGRLGDDKLQAEVRDDIRNDDGQQLAETLNRYLVKPFIDLNHGPQENYPELTLQALEQEDIKTLVDALEKLVPLGLEVEQSVVRDKIGLPDPAKGAVLLRPKDKQPPAEPAAAAAKPTAANRQQSSANGACPGCGSARNSQGDDGVDVVDELTEQTLADADGSDMVDEVYRLLAESGSLEEAQVKLLDIYDRIPLAATGEALGNRLFQADLTGRAEVLDEVGGNG